MDTNGQVITLPGVIVTKFSGGKVYVPFDNILFVEEEHETGSVIYLKHADGTQQISVKEKVQSIFSAEEAAKFSVDFSGAFMRGLSEKIAVMRKLQGG